MLVECGNLEGGINVPFLFIFLLLLNFKLNNMKNVFVLIEYVYEEYQPSRESIVGVYTSRELAEKEAQERVAYHSAPVEIQTSEEYLAEFPDHCIIDYDNYAYTMLDNPTYSYNIEEWEVTGE
jgi:hypothetical protein